MDIKELERLMVANGIVLRAIPDKIVKVYEKEDKEKFPDGTVKYIDAFRREMLVVEQVPKYAGTFVTECVQNTMSMVKFSGKVFYDSIEDAMKCYQEP